MDPRPASAVLAEHERRAAAQLPPHVFDYYDGGAGDEAARDDATAAWGRWRLRPHVLCDVGAIDLSVDVLGTRYPHPVMVAPTAWHRGLHPEAEAATAAGAADAGAVYVLSTRSSRPVEDIAAVAGPWWMQVYVTRDRTLTAALVARAVAAGATALVLTGDTPYLGRKRRQGRIFDLGDAALGDAALGDAAAAGPAESSDAAEQDPTVTTDAIAWLAESSGLPVFVKGVLRGDDTGACLDAGAAGVIVSNHGGRQLGRAVATATALPEVVAAAAGSPVLVDGGIRSGEDVAVALALGARAVLLGRPVLWGLATDGAVGVRAALDAVVGDTRLALALLGVPSAGSLGRDAVVRDDRW